MLDPYEVLGVSRGASQAEVKQSYRRLAKQWHPDRQQGDVLAAERFKEVAAAYHLLGDARQRSRFDRGEIDASGKRQANFRQSGAKRSRAKSRSAQRKSTGNRGQSEKASATASAANAAGAEAPQASAKASEQTKVEAAAFENFGFGGFSASDIFQPFFRGKKDSREDQPKGKAGDHRYQLEIGLLDAIKGGKKRLTLENGNDVYVAVPAGVEEGQIIRLKGMGEAAKTGLGAKPAGDALVEINILPHPVFVQVGQDIHVELPVTIQEAVLGAQIEVPTIDGPVSLTVPKGSNTNTRLRLRGKGVAERKTGVRGDQHMTLRIVLPENDKAFTHLVKDWAPGNDYDVRKGLRKK